MIMARPDISGICSARGSQILSVLLSAKPVRSEGGEVPSRVAEARGEYFFQVPTLYYFASGDLIRETLFSWYKISGFYERRKHPRPRSRCDPTAADRQRSGNRRAPLADSLHRRIGVDWPRSGRSDLPEGSDFSGVDLGSADPASGI